MIGKYKEMVCLITSYEEMAFKGWTESVVALTTKNLDEPLLIREETGLLRVNFGKHLMATLIEVKHLQKDFKHRVVPENVRKLFLRYVKFRSSKNILDQTVTRLSFFVENDVQISIVIISRKFLFDQVQLPEAADCANRGKSHPSGYRCT